MSALVKPSQTADVLYEQLLIATARIRYNIFDLVMIRNVAERALGFKAISSSVVEQVSCFSNFQFKLRIDFRFRFSVLWSTSVRSEYMRLRKKCLTTLSSREWKVKTASLPL